MARWCRNLVFVLSLCGVTAIVVPGLWLEHHNRQYLEKMGSRRATFEDLFTRIEIETGYRVFVTSGSRTTEQQRRLKKADSRNASPGRSPHEHGRAMDLNLWSLDGFVRKADSKETWEATGVPDIARGLGFRWGGDYRTYHDPVHFELRR
ncbi:MAG: M15 family metallopeptidase [Myxococcota bacterium]|jgi:hypothetical protein|nr:M15 family metallopeptidase [Myxococcota bacterium]